MLTAVSLQIVPTSQRLAVFSAMIAADGPWEDLELRLYKSPTSQPPADVVLADLIEADFGGYAAIAPIQLHGPFLAPDQSAVIVSDTAYFEATSDITPNTIYGAHLVNTAGDRLVAVFPFVDPVPMAHAGDALPVVVQLHYSGV